MTPAGYTEDALVEHPAISLFKKLSWENINAFFTQSLTTAQAYSVARTRQK